MVLPNAVSSACGCDVHLAPSKQPLKAPPPITYTPTHKSHTPNQVLLEQRVVQRAQVRVHNRVAAQLRAVRLQGQGGGRVDARGQW